MLLNAGVAMSTCFVIQPFDKGPFDKRYDEVSEPAIVAADLEPYRVDRDPAASIPIEPIESGIRNSQVCLAEITTDNPNVWFELGFAIASRKEVVLVCRQDRTRFPFDIQHRTIITYATDSPRDFEELKNRITKRIKALMAKEAKLENVVSISPLVQVEGLTQHEMVALVALAENTDNPSEAENISAYIIKQDMLKAGFTRIAITLALGALSKKNMIEASTGYDRQAGGAFTHYRLLDKGMSWLIDNQDRLALRAKSADDDDAPPI